MKTFGYVPLGCNQLSSFLSVFHLTAGWKQDLHMLMHSGFCPEAYLSLEGIESTFYVNTVSIELIRLNLKTVNMASSISSISQTGAILI